MPTLPTDPVAVEKLVRTELVTLFGGIEGLPNVLGHAVYVAGEADFIKRFGVKMEGTNKTEYRALFVVFIGFEDTDEGCDDNPVYKLVYVLRLVVSLNDQRADNTNSTDDFARFVMTLRDRALRAGHLAGYKQLRCERLTTDRSDFGPEERETGLTAHSIDLTQKVEVRPEAAEGDGE